MLVVAVVRVDSFIVAEVGNLLLVGRCAAAGDVRLRHELAELVAADVESVVELANDRLLLLERSLQRLDLAHQHLVSVVVGVARSAAETQRALAHRFLRLAHALRKQEVEGRRVGARPSLEQNLKADGVRDVTKV